MRLITLALAALLLLIQYPLWLGKGGWLRVGDLEAQVGVAHQKNAELLARNAKLDSEVRDLKDGTGAVEERARFELGMVKQNEIFVQILGKDQAPPSEPSPAPALPPTASAAPAPVSPSVSKPAIQSANPPTPKPLVH
ncbi:MAG: cell division protein FtsB [Pseudomonadota bacterium]